MACGPGGPPVPASREAPCRAISSPPVGGWATSSVLSLSPASTASRSSPFPLRSRSDGPTTPSGGSRSSERPARIRAWSFPWPAGHARQSAGRVQSAGRIRVTGSAAPAGTGRRVRAGTGRRVRAEMAQPGRGATSEASPTLLPGPARTTGGLRVAGPERVEQTTRGVGAATAPAAPNAATAGRPSRQRTATLRWRRSGPNSCRWRNSCCGAVSPRFVKRSTIRTRRRRYPGNHPRRVTR